MRLPYKIAVRFLKHGKGQTLLIILGIAIGVSVQVFIGSLIQGLQNGLVEKTIGRSSQITILPSRSGGLVENWESLVSDIPKADANIRVVSPEVSSSAFMLYKEQTAPVLLKGVDFPKADEIYRIREALYEGSLPVSQREVLVGRELQKELELFQGDTITLAKADGGKAEFHVSGFYDLKVAALNKSWVLAALPDVQAFSESGNRVTSIEMQVDKVFAADETALRIVKTLSDPDLIVQDWKNQNAQLLSGLNGQSISSLMIQVFVLVAVVLGIASVLAITVLQKSRQLGILKAMGIRNRDASLIFLLEGLLLGAAGAVLGILLGIGLSLVFTNFALNPDGTPVVELTLDAGFIALSAGIAVLSAITASLIPARRSSRLNPMEVIRNG